MRLLIVILVISVPCAFGKSTPYQPKDTTTLELIILHNNDMHARFEQTDKLSGTCNPNDARKNNCFGGFARVSTLVKKYRRDADNGGTAMLYLNAGDTYTGTPWFSIFKDRIASDFMNMLKPDAMCLGNHEFDMGVKGLLPFLDDVNFPVLIANLNNSIDHPLWQTRSLRRSLVIEMRGFKIGIIGYLTPETKTLVAEMDVEFVSEIDSINKEAKQLKENGVNIIIGLGHSGYDVDQKIAKKCPLIDVVIGGHSHSYLQSGHQPHDEQVEGAYPTIVTQPGGKRVPVVQAYAFTKYLGELNLSFKDGQLIQYSGRPILLNHRIEQDPEVLALENFYRPKVQEVKKKVYGVSRVLLDGSKCRFSECNIGNLIADAFVKIRLQQYNGSFMTDASVAFIGSGDIRASIKMGKITRFDLETVLPFENQIVTVNVTGKVLKQVLEHSVQRYSNEIGRGEFLQMSGVRVVYDMERSVGNRVVSVFVLCASCEIPSYQELQPNRVYGVMVSSFVYEGGDGYTMFKNLKPQYLTASVLEAVVEYVRRSRIVFPSIEGRIKILSDS